MRKHLAILGPAGSGKTTRVRNLAVDRTIFTSTTGVSAVNLSDSATTIHSLLHFHDRETFEYERDSNGLKRRLKKALCTKLVIDEVSMLQAYQLDGILAAADEVGVQVILTGDFCQLPPVPERKERVAFAFEGGAWSRVEVERLSTIHRQTDPRFLDGLRSLREGRPDCDTFSSCFVSEIDDAFEGTTLFATNAEVNAFNAKRLDQIHAAPRAYTPFRTGQQHRDWRDLQPVTVKCGARVMVTRNHRVDSELVSVNGDAGTVVECGEKSIIVHLERTDQHTLIPYHTQYWYEPGTQAEARRVFNEQIEILGSEDDDAVAIATRVMQAVLDAGLLGSIAHLPVRVAYALTVHKTQGLTLNAAQVNLRHPFMGQPGMVYVALSRVRALDGLRLIGGPVLLGARCSTHPKVQSYV